MAEFPLVRVPGALPVLRQADRLQRRLRGRLWSFDQVQWDGVGYGDRPEQRLHVWEPDDLAPRDGWPAVLLVHGGGFVEGSWEEFSALGPMLCRRGMVVAAASYRLAPTHRWPTPLIDIHAALDRVFGMQVDAARVAIWGASAGGTLALRAAQERPDLLCGVVAMGAPTDLGLLEDSRHWSVDALLDPEQVAAASPLHAPGALPPTLLLHGAADAVVPVAHSRLLAARYPDRVQLIEVPDGDHGLRWPPRPARKALRRAIDTLVGWQDPAPRGSKWKRKGRERR